MSDPIVLQFDSGKQVPCGQPVGDGVATGNGLTFVGLWAAAVFIFFSHDVKVIIELCTLF